MNNIGSSAEPWGTPYIMAATDELEPLIRTNSRRVEKYDAHQFSAVEN